jgi:NAD(P)-dependent dehydrogenase (short-subunit alcohol dehydrogenase family)
MLLQEKVILITGAKGGLGTFVTNSFLEAGARVFGVSRSIADSDFPHPNFSAIAAELSDGDRARQVADIVAKKAGRIDGLVHLVGAFAGGDSVAETDDAALDKMLNLNLRSAFHVVRAVLPIMRAQGSGRIVAIGSKAAVEPAPMAGVYGASKAALVSLMRTVARENSDQHVSANIVLPGTMDTPANRAADPTADFSKWVHPCQVAKLLVHLVSDQASQVSGAVIPIYGGEA